MLSISKLGILGTSFNDNVLLTLGYWNTTSNIRYSINQDIFNISKYAFNQDKEAAINERSNNVNNYLKPSCPISNKKGKRQDKEKKYRQTSRHTGRQVGRQEDSQSGR